MDASDKINDKFLFIGGLQICPFAKLNLNVGTDVPGGP